MSRELAPNHPGVNGREQTPPNLYSTVDAMRVDGPDDIWRPDMNPGSSSYPKPDGLLPAFSSTHYSHLPTPLSPSDANRLVNTAPHFAPESPLHQSSQPFDAAAGSLSQRFSQRSSVDEGNALTRHHPQQTLTPESSPHVPRIASSRQTNSATPSYQTPSRLGLESSIFNTPPNLNPTFQPSSSPESQPPSILSSPFQAKLTPKPSRSPPSFSSQVQPEASSSNVTSATIAQPGGEMERIRQVVREERCSYLKEAEARRPDYLTRFMPDPSAMVENERLVGIMETPVKGRRIKLFQETSEESFEESLMAGGYGRYRTADWVRQPQPLSSVLAGTPNIVQKLETVQEDPPQPPTEKELKKRKRLEAFRSSRSEGSTRSRLYPVELEGKGRVLLDIPNEQPHHNISASPEFNHTPAKKRTSASKRKAKKGSTETLSKDRRVSEQPVGTEDLILKQKPNWPDAEFPWKLRTEEREEAAKVEEQERMKVIDRYFDGDSDEDEEDPPPVADPEGEDVPAGYGPEKLPPPRMGRGKHVPLLAHPEDPRKSIQNKRIIFPTDPGDARAALLAKRSVRALSYRQQRRQRELNDDDSDADDLCICHGKDDGRELVQCDGCQTWYHLECLGIPDVEELGREEDPWFCRWCLHGDSSPSPGPEPLADVPMSEPMFVPTDETPTSLRERSSDATLYPPSTLHDSPSWPPQRIPKTPTRGRATLGQTYHHQGPPWPDFSKHPTSPMTPKGSAHPVRVYAPTNTPSGPNLDTQGYRVVEESPFDPTSTPSRGIRFSGAFSTPKINAWSSRPGPLTFQTPFRPSHRGDRTHRGSESFGGRGSLSAALDDGSRSTGAHIENLGLKPALHLMLQQPEESPVRRSVPRNRSRDARRGGLGESPMPVMPRFLEESPVMRTMQDRSARA